MRAGGRGPPSRQMRASPMRLAPGALRQSGKIWTSTWADRDWNGANWLSASLGARPAVFVWSGVLSPQWLFPTVAKTGAPLGAIGWRRISTQKSPEDPRPITPGPADWSGAVADACSERQLFEPCSSSRVGCNILKTLLEAVVLSRVLNRLRRFPQFHPVDNLTMAGGSTSRNSP